METHNSRHNILYLGCIKSQKHLSNRKRKQLLNSYLLLAREPGCSQSVTKPHSPILKCFFCQVREVTKRQHRSCQSSLSIYFTLPSKTSDPVEKEGETKSSSLVAGSPFLLLFPWQLMLHQEKQIKRINSSWGQKCHFRHQKKKKEEKITSVFPNANKVQHQRPHARTQGSLQEPPEKYDLKHQTLHFYKTLHSTKPLDHPPSTQEYRHTRPHTQMSFVCFCMSP